MVIPKQKVNKKTWILLALLGVSIFIGVYIGYRTTTGGHDASSDGPINYRPPTEEEKAAGDKVKQDIDEKEKNQQENSNKPAKTTEAKKKVEVIITDAGQYDNIVEVRSFIPSFYQEGTCTINFRKDTQALSRKMPATIDSSSTICMNPQIKRSDFPSSGDWEVSVSYNSQNAMGTSEKHTITIK